MGSGFLGPTLVKGKIQGKTAWQHTMLMTVDVLMLMLNLEETRELSLWVNVSKSLFWSQLSRYFTPTFFELCFWVPHFRVDKGWSPEVGSSSFFLPRSFERRVYAV